jgi:hypothetical protein
MRFGNRSDVSEVPTTFRPFASMGWGGRAASAFRGLLQTDNQNVTGRTVINRGQAGTIQYRSIAPTINTAISGITRDSAGNPLGACITELLQSGGDRLTQTVVSDAGGNFKFDNPGSGPFFIRSYKDGAPNLAGVTDRNLTAV